MDNEILEKIASGLEAIAHQMKAANAIRLTELTNGGYKQPEFDYSQAEQLKQLIDQ